MAGKYTFTIIKPEAVKRNLIGKIFSIIEGKGFKIVNLKKLKLTKEQASKFYEIHKKRPFYNDLVNYMSSGFIIVAILEKDNAVLDFRTVIGATNPKDADEGTIRKLFAKSIEQNAIHGSDSDENAVIESNFFFSEFEKF